jgi:pimeloyl-ACP methyl ester carboxylesterase
MASLPRATATTAGSEPTRSQPTSRGLHLTVEGLRLWVRAWPGEGLPVLLLHGGMAHSGWWHTVAPELGPSCRPFAFDRRGHGESDWADPERYGWDRDIADIEEVMSRLDPGPWLLVGHSQGGLLAAEVAASGRVALAGMALVDIPLEPRSPDLRRTGRALRRMPQIHYATIADAVRRFQPFPAEHRIPEDELRRLAEESFRPTPDGRCTSRFHWQRFQADGEPEDEHPLDGFADRLDRIAVPTLVLRGAESTILSRKQFDAMVRRIPRARGVEIPDSTHNIHAEQPVAVGRALREFVAELSPRPPGPPAR